MNMCFSKQIKWFDICPERQMANRNRSFLGFHSIVRRLAGDSFLLHPATGRSRSRPSSVALPATERCAERSAAWISRLILIWLWSADWRSESKIGDEAEPLVGAVRLKRLRRPERWERRR
uniref:Uncharacterized protein n=1 Tax=Arundo donax TaxID=35708 RepID=A0A0A9CIM9_ARUDO